MKNKKNKYLKTTNLIFLMIFFALIFCIVSIPTSALSGNSGRIVYDMWQASADGYIPVDFHVETSTVTETNKYSALKRAVTVPAKYDSRDYSLVTNVKDQGDYGACWAFASMAAAESSLIKEFPEQYSSSTTDLSELHLSYFTYNTVPDALGLTSGEGLKLTNKNDTFLNQGGNLYFTTFQLSKWFGVADESVAPYTKASKSFSLSAKTAYNSNSAVLENAVWVSMKNQSKVKEMIMKYGCGGVSYYHNELYLNSKTSAYYYPYESLTLIANHSVAVVGWDDNYSKNNFKSFLFKPKNNGAWLIKNSYGTDFGDGGYIWISYEDSTLFEDDAIFFDFMPTNTYEKNYQYDMSDIMGAYYKKDSLKMANVFTAQSNEKLGAISFTTLEENVTYSVQIYKNISSSENPTKGTKVYSTELTSTLPNAGYHTISLPEEIQLNKSEKFSVVITLNLKGKNVSAIIDEPSEDSGVTSVTKSKKGQSFCSFDGGKTWDDLYSKGYMENLRIKAFTNSGIITPTSLSIGNVSSAGVAVNSTMALTSSASPKTAYDKVKWSSSDTSVATVSSKGVVTGKKSGYAVITCTTVAGNISKSVKIKVKPATPTGLKQVTCTNSAYSFSWNKVTGARVYEIYKYDSATKSVLFVAKKTNTTFSLKSRKNNEKTKYYVRAVTTVDGKDIKSDFQSIYVVTKPSKVTVKYSAKTSTSATIKWNKSAGATGYIIYKYNSTTKKYTKVKYTTALNLKITGLKKNTPYIFCVKPYVKYSDTGFYGDISNKLSIRTAK